MRSLRVDPGDEARVIDEVAMARVADERGALRVLVHQARAIAWAQPARSARASAHVAVAAARRQAARDRGRAGASPAPRAGPGVAFFERRTRTGRCRRETRALRAGPGTPGSALPTILLVVGASAPAPARGLVVSRLGQPQRIPHSGNIITTAQSNSACASTPGASLPKARAIPPHSRPAPSAAIGSTGSSEPRISRTQSPRRRHVGQRVEHRCPYPRGARPHAVGQQLRHQAAPRSSSASATTAIARATSGACAWSTRGSRSARRATPATPRAWTRAGSPGA